MNRDSANNCLLNVIQLYLKIYPKVRFIQALWTLSIIDSDKINILEDSKIIDRFYEEPYETIKRIRPRIETLIESEFPESSTLSMRLLRNNIKRYLKDEMV